MYEDAKMIRAMGVCKVPKGQEEKQQSIYNSGEYIAQLKKDGYWYEYEKTMEGNSYLFSRKEGKNGTLTEKSANVPHLMRILDQLMPPGTILCTEIYYPGGKSNDVTKIMGCNPDKAVSRQNGDYGLIHMYIHDILMYDGKLLLDQSNLERCCILHEVAKKHNLSHYKCIDIAKTWFSGKQLDKVIANAIAKGEEGVVLKKKDGFFEPGERPLWNWLKFKTEDYCDVFCIGFEPPTKEYEGENPDTWKFKEGDVLISKNYAKGWIGALRMGVYKDGQQIDIGEVSAGITDEMFEDIKQHPENYLNQPMLVRCMNPTERALRHSTFISIRDDINITDCTWEKIFN